MATEQGPVDVQVWCGRPSAEHSRHAGLLDGAERERRAALRRAEDRARFTVATALAKLAAGRWLGLPAGAIAIARTCAHCGRPHGRPQLPGTGLSLSISHSGDRVLVALTGGPPVGVDVEQVAPVDLAGLAGHVLGAGERADTLPEFFCYWTRKEALVKATGDGLRAALTEVAVTPPDQPPRLLRYRDRPDLVAGLADLAAGDRYAAAVAVLAPDPLRVRQHDGSALLAAA